MSELESFLNAIEAEPIDDAPWLVFADWLEEQGHALASEIRRTVEVGDWHRGRKELLVPLDRRTLRWIGSEFIEKALPIFERRFPEERSQRLLLEAARHPRAKGMTAATKAVNAAWRTASRAATNDPEAFLAAASIILAVYHLNGWPASVPERISDAIVSDRFGRISYGKPIASYRPEWLAVWNFEVRRQVARILRHRLSLERGSG